ncbi:tyrosine-type recombinase/integrase [Petroclostridium xylanilyticum]|uniref:tyrosine-type recombinase/integrase n=1 Tax=Petroclostridium xylanilyticum TaxID=1792311 RepID=UPI003119BC3D
MLNIQIGLNVIFQLFNSRIITIPPFLCTIIQDYVQKLYDYEPSDRLFPVTKYYLHHEMDRGCKKSKVKRIRIHDLRHSHASLLIEMGFSPLLISERLGHENIQTITNIFPSVSKQAWRSGTKTETIK